MKVLLSSFIKRHKEWQQQYANTLQNFLYSKGIDTFLGQYNVDGTMVIDTLQALYPESNNKTK